MQKNKQILIFTVIVIVGFTISYLNSLIHDTVIEGKNPITQKQTDIQKEDTSPIHMLFAGDVMLDRMTRTTLKEKGSAWITQNIERIFLGQDLNIANLEGPVTHNASVSVSAKSNTPEHYRFTFDPDMTRDFFRSTHINVVNIGNNHTGNFGISGIHETESFLKENDVLFFGNPKDFTKISAETTIKNKKIAFVSYNEFSAFGVTETENEIRKMKSRNDIVIVYCHWGTEYALRENRRQTNAAHAFIDAGADAVIGSHPHVVEPIEIYKNTAIFYSLGNFVFDQYFSEDTRSRLVLGVSFEKQKTNYILIPIWTEKNGRLILTDEEEKQKLLKRLADTSIVPDMLRSEILNGTLSLNSYPKPHVEAKH